MTWEQRIAAYAAATKFPPAMSVDADGIVFGIWVMGNDYRVRSEYYGGYPPTYLRRVKALFPEKSRVLHLFSGHVDQSELPGDTVDADPALDPTYVDDAQSLESVPLHTYDLVVCDPPYSIEDAEHYGPSMVNRSKVFRALSRCRAGTHTVWLDQVLPMYRKADWAIEARIGMVKSTNHRFRCVTVFRKRADDPAEGL